MRGPAEQIGYVKRVVARHDVLDHRFPIRNDLGRILQFRHVERQPQNLAARRVHARNQVERIVATEAGDFNLIAELRDLLPRPIWPEQVMREVSAITICYRRENVFAIARSFESDLRNSGELFANRISVLGVGRAEFVEINLLIKIKISVRPLAFPGKARVINSSSIAVPGGAASCRWILNMRNRVRQRLARRGLVKVKCAVFAAAFGKRHRDIFAIQ